MTSETIEELYNFEGQLELAVQKHLSQNGLNVYKAQSKEIKDENHFIDIIADDVAPTGHKNATNGLHDQYNLSLTLIVVTSRIESSEEFTPTQKYSTLHQYVKSRIRSLLDGQEESISGFSQWHVIDYLVPEISISSVDDAHQTDVSEMTYLVKLSIVGDAWPELG